MFLGARVGVVPIFPLGLVWFGISFGVRVDVVDFGTGEFLLCILSYLCGLERESASWGFGGGPRREGFLWAGGLFSWA